MKTIKARIAFMAILVLAVIGTLTTCKVGLGDSVDTKAPLVSITYPPVQSIIKNSFTIRGTASDESELVGVTLKFTNTATNLVYDGYRAQINAANKTWSFVANARLADNSFTFPDGKYQVIATAVDAANRKSVASSTYEIDNTAPVLVLNRPGTMGPLPTVIPEVYGTELKLTGSANDDHALDLLSMTVFTDAGVQVGAPLTYANVSGVGLEIVLAKKYASPANAEEQELTDRYNSIYNTTGSETQNFYCLVDISDYAREYDPPAAVASANNNRGNVSQAYWLYDEVYSNVFDNAGYGLTMSQLTSVFNGSYTNATEAAQVRSYLATKEQSSSSWTTNAATFSLNPNNQPSFEVVGYTPLSGSVGVDDYKISNNAQITIRISAGRDQKPLDADTFQISLDPCDSSAVPADSSDFDNIVLFERIANLGGDAGLIAARNALLQKSGNDYLVTLSIGIHNSGDRFLVQTTGNDLAGYEISDEDAYGFRIISSGNPPVIAIAAPTDLSYTSANSVAWNGTVSTDGGIASFVGSANFYNTADNSPVVLRQNEVVVITLNPAGPPNTWNWNFTLNTQTNIPLTGTYRAVVQLTATDVQGNETITERRVNVDHEPPTVVITSVTPAYEYNEGTGVYTINGQVSVKMAFSDNDQLANLTYKFGTLPIVAVAPITAPSVSRTQLVNTIGQPDLAFLPLVVAMTDRAGNVRNITINDELFVNQSTDVPIITLTNLDQTATAQGDAADNGLSGVLIKGDLADDDSIASLDVTIYDTLGVVVKATQTLSGALSGTGKNRQFSYDVSAGTPLADGIYRLSLLARDNNAPPVTSAPVSVWFSYDTTPPVQSSLATNPAGLTVTNADFSLSGSGYDANALKTANAVVITQRLGAGTKIPVPLSTLVLGGDAKTCTWTLGNLPRVPTVVGIGGQVPFNGTRDGVYEYEIILYDQSGQTSTETVSVRLDSTVPTVNPITNPPASPAAGNVVGINTTFSGTAGDGTGIGIRQVEYSLNGIDWATAAGTTNWTIPYAFAGGDTEGAKTLSIRAEDNANNLAAGGNISATVTRPFIFDRADPTVSIDGGAEQFKDGAFTLTGTAYDTNGVSTITVIQTSGGGAVPTGITINAAGAPTYTWAVTGLPRNPSSMVATLANDGVYTYTVQATDAAGKVSTIANLQVTIDTTAPSVNSITAPAAGSVGLNALSGTSYIFRGSASDAGVGVAKIWYLVNTTAAAPVVPGGSSPSDPLYGYTEMATIGSWNFTRNLVAGVGAPTATDLHEGEGYYLHVLAEDKSENRTPAATTRTFDIDLANPGASETEVGTTTMVNRRVGFFLEGDATDTHGIDTIVITQSMDGGSKLPISTNGPVLTPDGTGFDWILDNLPRGNTAGTIGAQTLVDGTYEYEITVTDQVGKTHTITRRIKFDSTGPVLQFISPAEASWQSNAAVTVTGLATDLTAVGGVYYSTAVGAPALPVNPANNLAWTGLGWQVAGGTVGSWQVAQTGLAEGSHGVWVSAMDTNGNTTPAIQRTFGVDLNLPALTGVNTPPADTNTGFNLTGTATDTNALAGTPVTITQSKDGGAAVVISGNIGTGGTAQNTNWTLANLPRNPVSPNTQIAFVPANDGAYDYVITATDVAGKTREITRTVRIDTQEPTLTGSTTLSGWKNIAAIPVSVTLTETGSGISSVTYSLSGGPANALSLSEGIWGGNVSVSDGANQTVTFTATDKAGNAVTSATSTFSVDTILPELNVVTPSGPRRTNLLSDVVATYTATDTLSGVASVLVKSIGGTAIDPGDQTSTPGAGDSWSITLPPATLAGLTGSPVVTTELFDVAGNKTTQTFSLIVDIAPPSVSITSPANGATINKLTEIRGTASDAQMLDTVDLYIEDPVSGVLPAVPTASFSGGSAYNWSHNFDTEAWELAGGSGDASVRVIATDEAGNTVTLDYTYTVDQESDRPRIRSNNVDFNELGTFATTLRTKNIIGTIDDDDGKIKSVEIWNGETSAWDPVTLSGSSFTYTTPGGDGDKSLLFRIEDKIGETFETDGALPPRFEWGSGGTGEYSYVTQQYRVDTTSPAKMPQVYVHRSGGTTFAEAVELTPNMPFGGDSDHFVLWLGADDDNGIASIEVTVPGPTPQTQTLTSVNIDQPASITDYTVFRSGAFDISAVGPGTLTISIVIEDASGLQSFDSKIIFIDNDEPVIDHTYPVSETDQVFGNLTISGLAADDGSGLQSIEYKIGYNYASIPSWSTAPRSGASWTITDFATTGGGERIENFARKPVESVSAVGDTLTVTGHGYTIGTQVWIGSDSLPGGLAHSTKYYVRDATANTFKLAASSGGVAINITSTGDSSTGVSSVADSIAGNIWRLPVMIRARDKAGNEYVTPEWDYLIRVDPSGDKPTAFVSYPEADVILAEPNPIVGGTIRMSGYAEDNVDVSAVFMQIDANGDGLFTVADNGHVTVGGTPVDWYGSNNGKQVNGGRNWTVSINTAGEFNPLVAGTRRLVMYRVRARDNNGLYGSWTEPHYFEIDEGVPKFASLALKQGGRTRLYEPDMWLSGDWNLTGTLLDESNINSVIVGNTVGASTSYVTGNLTTPGWFAPVTDGGLSGYELNIPVNTQTSFPGGQTSHSFTISATDMSDPSMNASREIRVNYDNTDPDVSAAFGGVIPIRNSNGSYEFSSSVVEAESGFDRVMVVLHRPTSITREGERVYNPLYGTGDPRNYTDWDLLTQSSEGLPLKEYSGATRLTESSLTLAGISSDPYARTGYYLRIGGMYYLITDVTGDTISWNGEVDETETDFALVYAFAVDKLTTEVVDQDGDGIIESVTRSGGTYEWSCSIDSTNLPDGQMHIRYIAFDMAGNFASPTDIETRVENNPPRLAAVTLGTDLSGDGSITENEWNPPYSTLVAGVEQKTITIDATDLENSFTAKDFMEVIIDVVGGNGDLEYSLVVGATTVHTLEDNKLRTGEYDELNPSANTISVTLAQLRAMGDGVRNFIFSIWDSTETYNTGDSADFKAVLTVTLTVDVVDEIAPVTVISPFFWNSAIDNSLFENSKTNGHIELEADLPAGIFNPGTGLFDLDPKVSGKISIRGTAYDDQRITALWMFIGNNAAVSSFNFPPTAVTKAFGGKTYYQMATYTPGSGWAVTASTMAANGWVFSVDDDYLNQNGHLVSWQLDWNTAEITLRAAVDRYVRIVAEDKRTNAVGVPTPNASSELIDSNPGDVTTNNVPNYRMDVVPYIRTIGSVLSKIKKNNPSVYSRTALGRYPVNGTETITLSGFNLGGDQTVSMVGQASGDYAFTVNTITTLNNDNNNNAEYNQLPNGDNNPNLTDDVYLDVWDFNSQAAHSVNGSIDEPIMKINPDNGIVGFAFANGVDSFSMANGTTNSYTRWQQNYADYGEVAFGFDFAGRSHGIVIGHDTEPSAGYTGRMNYVTSRWGVPLTDARDNFRYYSKLRLESCGLPIGADLNGTELTQRMIDTTRFQSPSLAVASSATRTDPTLYLAYYDNLQEQIRFRWGTNNDATRAVGDTGFNQFYDVDTAAGRNSTANNAYGEHVIFEPDASRYSLIAGDENDATGDTGNTAGEYVAIDVITGTTVADDVVTIVWYDGANLMYTYRYGAKDDTNASSGGVANKWSEPILIFEDAGLDCAISVDDTVAHGVHIAAYDRIEGGLRYAYLPSYDADESEVQTCMVDDYNIVGNKISITTVLDANDDAVPYISYYMPSAQKPKLAYLVNPAGVKAPDGVNEDTEFTGAWEVTMIPTASTVREDRVNVDLWRDANNRAKNSTLGTSSSNATSGTVYGNTTSNPLAAYVVNVGTRGYIETAQKR